MTCIYSINSAAYSGGNGVAAQSPGDSLEEGSSPVIRPIRREVAPGSAYRWEAIRYALDSTPRTAQLCVIMLAAR